LPVGRNHLPLKIESVHTGHSHVENQTCRILRLSGIQKRLRRSEPLRAKSDRPDQIVEGVPGASSSSTIAMSGTLGMQQVLFSLVYLPKNGAFLGAQ
jgi:hypothetical protein